MRQRFVQDYDGKYRNPRPSSTPRCFTAPKTIVVYRDSKGRFVSRKVLVEEVKKMIDIAEHAATNRIYQTFPPQILQASRRTLASYIRQFRNKHKIYETF